jgi:radical SAM superfamily enzyme YgiQ (UPF0313 family)
MAGAGNMSILLVKLPEPVRQTQKPTYMPPIGLWSIEHNVRKALGVEVLTIDCHLDGDLTRLDRWLDEQWTIVGLSAQFSIQHSVYVEAAELCMERGVKRVIAGGFHAASVPAPPGVTDVIRGSGEIAFGIRFEDIEYPRPNAERMARYWAAGSPHDLQSKTDRWMPVEFSRGCARRCGYCGVNRYWGPTQYFSRAKIGTYLDTLCAEGIEEIFIEDDNFIADDNNFDWIIGALRERGIWWSTPNGISAKKLASHVQDLAESKCWRVSLPFETGTESTARLMGLSEKWMPQGEALSLCRNLHAEGIKTCGFFIIGYPGETLDDMQKTLDYANSLPLDQRNIYIATPYPGTPLYDLCVEKGYLVSQPPQLYEDLLYTRGLIRTPEFEPGQVEELKAKDREAAIARRDHV